MQKQQSRERLKRSQVSIRSSLGLGAFAVILSCNSIWAADLASALVEVARTIAASESAHSLTADTVKKPNNREGNKPSSKDLFLCRCLEKKVVSVSIQSAVSSNAIVNIGSNNLSCIRIDDLPIQCKKADTSSIKIHEIGTNWNMRMVIKTNVKTLGVQSVGNISL
jgi:hypothetical protein